MLELELDLHSSRGEPPRGATLTINYVSLSLRRRHGRKESWPVSELVIAITNCEIGSRISIAPPVRLLFERENLKMSGRRV